MGRRQVERKKLLEEGRKYIRKERKRERERMIIINMKREREIKKDMRERRI